MNFQITQVKTLLKYDPHINWRPQRYHNFKNKFEILSIPQIIQGKPTISNIFLQWKISFHCTSLELPEWRYNGARFHFWLSPIYQANSSLTLTRWETFLLLSVNYWEHSMRPQDELKKKATSFIIYLCFHAYLGLILNVLFLCYSGLLLDLLELMT